MGVIPGNRVRWGGWLPRGLILVAALLATPSTPLVGQAHAAPNRAASVKALGKRLAGWVEEGTKEAHGKAIARIEAGVPPEALVAFLQAVEKHPHERLETVVLGAASYRRVKVRGHALLAFAEISPKRAVTAIERAANDPDAVVRRLAVAMADLHPSSAADQIIRELLGDDDALAKEVAEYLARREAELARIEAEEAALREAEEAELQAERDADRDADRDAEEEELIVIDDDEDEDDA